jgi:SAM-dependent methyltransferase
MTNDSEDRWKEYYSRLRGREPRPLFTKALGFLEPTADRVNERAIDLGCGDGTETRVLLRQGWNVLAIDAQDAAIRLLSKDLSAEDAHRLETKAASFVGMPLPSARFIYAGMSLPFCSAASFSALWQEIIRALRPDGLFAGHFLGPRDSWAGHPNMHFLARREIEAMTVGLSVESIEEREEDQPTALGDRHHWHIVELIARKQ